jgi:hypothetical protein
MTHIAQDVLAAFGTRKFEFRHTFQDLLADYLLPLPLIFVQTFPAGCLHFRNTNRANATNAVGSGVI